MLSHRDRDILRPLAARVREIAELPEMAVRRSRWTKLNALRPERPMVLCSPEGAWTEILPQRDWVPGSPMRLRDVWGFAESQETVGVSPRMFEELVLPCQVPLLERFGLNCYGCCEPLERRIDAILKNVPRLRRVSVSPWADQKVMADKLGKSYVFSKKPHPTLVATGFDERAIRDDLRKTLRIAGNGVLEIVMKDTHTVQGDPTRLTRWVRIALEEVNAFADGKRPSA
jgi:hypothetical protein